MLLNFYVLADANEAVEFRRAAVRELEPKSSCKF